MNDEDKIPLDDDAIGVLQLRKLHELQDFNRALTTSEFLEIIKVYDKAAARMMKKYEDSLKNKKEKEWGDIS